MRNTMVIHSNRYNRADSLEHCYYCRLLNSACHYLEVLINAMSNTNFSSDHCTLHSPMLYRDGPRALTGGGASMQDNKGGFQHKKVGFRRSSDPHTPRPGSTTAVRTAHRVDIILSSAIRYFIF